jgi:DNA-binding transcriptional MerR regulator
MSSLTIGQVAERTGFRASALRYYEDLGLVTPSARTDAGYRLYDDDALSRLAFIARAKQLGCSLEEITDLLGVWDGERCGPVQRRFHELVTDKLGTTQRQITELIAFASQLRTAAARLDTPPIDGPCDSDCTCLAEHDSALPTPVRLSVAAGDPPIACTLQADAMPQRIEQWQALLETARARVMTPDGRLRVEFDRGIDFGELARLVEAEQQCCSFFAFTVTIDGRGVALEIDAPDDAAPSNMMRWSGPTNFTSCA